MKLLDKLVGYVASLFGAYSSNWYEGGRADTDGTAPNFVETATWHRETAKYVAVGAVLATVGCLLLWAASRTVKKGAMRSVRRVARSGYRRARTTVRRAASSTRRKVTRRRSSRYKTR